MAENEFQEWVKSLVDKHFDGRFQLFADRVGVTFSALKRSVKNGSTSVETLLRICLETGEPPATVFTRAGKQHVHELITQLYGAPASLPLSKRAKQVALAFDALKDEGAKSFYAESLAGLTAAEQLREQNGGTSTATSAAKSGKARTRGTRSGRA